MKLRLEQIPPGDKLRLDAAIFGVSERDWTLKHLDDNTVTLSHAVHTDTVTIPLAYVEAVYPTTETDILWEPPAQ